ncbi:neutral/alkaline non-lysosomal ceramidase N-terminal domain-containing protein [Flindersiella endophytica]
MSGRILLLGRDRVDITPALPVPLAGFAARAELGKASSVLAPLRLRTLAFGSGSTRAVLLSADLLWWGTDVAARVRARVASRFGLHQDAVFLHATHNHSGPQVSYRFVPSLGEPDDAFIEQLCGAAEASAGRALGSLREVWLERTAGLAELGVDRRSARTRGAVPETPITNEVTVLRFRSVSEDRTEALLVHYACHPVVHHGNAVTSDFAGAAMDLLEQRHPGALAVYAQGCCGDINPDLYTDGVYAEGDQPVVNAFGTRLADAVDRALADGFASVGAPRVAAEAWDVELPVAAVPGKGDLREKADTPGVTGEWARLLLANPDRLTPTVPVRFSRLRLAENLTLLGMSGEPVSAYGTQVKAESAGTALPLGYTGGMTGYLVTARHLSEGGYEPAEAPYYFAMPAPLSPEAEPVLRQAISRAL